MALTPEDHREIQTLYARYNFAIDTGTAEEWADCFTQEGSFRIRGQTHAGRDALLAFARAVHAKPVKSRHWNSNLIIEESATGATGKAYIVVIRLTATPRIVDITGVYEDHLRKTGEGWKFSSRKAPFDNVS